MERGSRGGREGEGEQGREQVREGGGEGEREGVMGRGSR